MLDGIKAVAFDIDGTLYSSPFMIFKVSPHVFRHPYFYINFSVVRSKLHKQDYVEDFYKSQNEALAKKMHKTPEEAEKLLNDIIYNGMKPYFLRLKPFKGVVDVIKELHQKGYKIAMLSDFPPEQKEDIWGIRQYCDVLISSEKVGALKPHREPFMALSNGLGVKPEEILYVGNSSKFDVVGAKTCGMKSALILSGFKKLFNIKDPLADFCFKNYRQFRDIVLE